MEPYDAVSEFDVLEWMFLLTCLIFLVTKIIYFVRIFLLAGRNDLH